MPQAVDHQRVYYLREASLIVLFSYLLLFASSHNGLIQPLTVAISAALFSLIALYRIATGWGMRLPVDKPLWVFLGVLLLTALTSIDPRRSLAEVWLVAAAVLWFSFAADLVGRGWPAELVIKSLLIVGAIIMLFSWLEAVQWYLRWLSAAPGEWLPGVTYRLPLPNFIGAALNGLLMMAAARLMRTRQWGGRILLSLWIISALGLLYLTSSRGGWLGALAGFACLAFLTIGHAPDAWKQKFQRTFKDRRMILYLSAPAILLIAFLGWVLHRQTQHPTHAPIAIARVDFWTPAWKAFVQSPLFGQGPFTFISFYLQEHSIPPDQLFVYAHSIYMDLLSGSGILGLLAFLWLAAAVARVLLKRLSEMDSANRPIVFGGLGAMCAFCVHGLVDSVHHTIPISGWMFALLLGTAVGAAGPLERPRRWAGGAFLALLVAAFAWVNLWMLLPYQKGVDAANQGDWRTAVAHLEQAARRDGRLAVVHQQLGLAQSMLAAQGDGEALQPAIRSFERAVALDPYWGVNHANLGALYHANGDLDAAARALRQAVARAPDSALFLLNLGLLEEERNDPIAAEMAYQQTLTIAPQDAEAHFWRATEFRRQVYEDWLASQPASPPPSTGQLEQELAAHPASAAHHNRLAAAFLEQGESERAQRLWGIAGLVYFDRPAEQLERLWLGAELAAAGGDFLEAARLGEEALEGYRVQGVYGPGSYGALVYSQLMFRRPAIQDDLAPQLAHIELPDEWGRRMEKTAGWLEQTGNQERCRALLEEQAVLIPDYGTRR